MENGISLYKNITDDVKKKKICFVFILIWIIFA